MNQINQNKTSRPETEKFEGEMDFYVPIGIILVELDSSNYKSGIETRNILGDEKRTELSDTATNKYSILAQKSRSFGIVESLGEVKR